MLPNVKPRILCVDDDADILEGFKQNLRRHFNLHLAHNANEALEKIKEKDFEVILTDMRMPGMDGAKFLQESRKIAPDAVRLLLTGQCDTESAISAVNDGQVFRFLTKPCNSKDLKEILDSAVTQHRLITAEKDLLQKTLKGSIKVLTDALAITSPLAFGRAKRLHKRVAQVARSMNLNDSWHVEISSMLIQLGAISIDEATLEKEYLGIELTDKEQAEIKKIPELTLKLLENIPRLERVVKLIDEVFHSGKTLKKEMSIPAQILMCALDIDELEMRGVETSLAISSLNSRENTYKNDIIEIFIRLFGNAEQMNKIKEIPAAAIKAGMIVAEDIYTRSGALLVTKGFEITESFAAKSKSFKKDFLKEPLRVIVLEDNNVSET